MNYRIKLPEQHKHLVNADVTHLMKINLDKLALADLSSNMRRDNTVIRPHAIASLNLKYIVMVNTQYVCSVV
jgi:hypothetical protein